MSSIHQPCTGDAEISNNQVTSTALFNGPRLLKGIYEQQSNNIDAIAKIEQRMEDDQKKLDALENKATDLLRAEKSLKRKIESGKTIDTKLEILPEEGNLKEYQEREIEVTSNGVTKRKRVAKPSNGVLVSMHYLESPDCVFKITSEQWEELKDSGIGEHEQKVVVHVAKKHKVYSKKQFDQQKKLIEDQAAELKKALQVIAEMNAQKEAAAKAAEQGGPSSA